MDYKEQLEKAKAGAYRYIGFRPRSVREVATYLQRKGFGPETINDVIKSLEEYGYLNDRNFARQWVVARTGHKPMGVRRIKQELALKGVPRQVIEESLADISGEEELRLARVAAEKRLRARPWSYKQMLAFLERRGFSGEVAARVCRENKDKLLPEKPHTRGCLKEKDNG